MIKILTIIGARPQFIKAAAISRAIRTHFSDQLEEIIIHTGQHYDPLMSQVFFEELNIPKENYNLEVGSSSHAVQTAEMMVKIEKVVMEEKPDAILMYGDTNSTLAGTLVAAKIHLPIIHVEAGVRSYEKDYPEEVNRIICDHLSSMLFVPTISGMESLEKEGIAHVAEAEKRYDYNKPGVFLCGDIMYDNTLYFSQNIEEKVGDYFSRNNLPDSNYILSTIHRPNNTDRKEDLTSILDALAVIAEKYDKEVILPLHPRTQKQLKVFGVDEQYRSNPKLHITNPASFLEMIALQKNCDLVMTDSGGVQKEAFFMKKPAVILLEETPWVELVESKNALLGGNNKELIIQCAEHFLNMKDAMEFPPIYGDGKASEFVCEQIISRFSGN